MSKKGQRIGHRMKNHKVVRMPKLKEERFFKKGVFH